MKISVTAGLLLYLHETLGFALTPLQLARITTALLRLAGCDVSVIVNESHRSNIAIYAL